MGTAFIAVLKRELRAYFFTPLAYVFLSVYLLVSGLSTWNLARFFDTAIASLTPFFQFQPWLLAIFMPALGMRLWSEDLRQKTADLYFTSGRPLWLIHLAKLCAGLSMLLLALVTTLPYWLVVNYLGPADNGVIFAAYASLFGVGLIFTAVTLVFSALTQQQVIAFVLSTLTCFALLTLGLSGVTGQLSGKLPDPLLGWLQGFSLLDGFFRSVRGVITLSDILFGFGLAALLFAIGLYALRHHRRRGDHVRLPYGFVGLAALLITIPIARSTLATTTTQFRLDLTGYQLNTLSPAARDLAASLNEPIELTFFYNETVGRDYPEVRAHAERVRAMLKAYVRASGGKLTLTEINPEPFSAGEDIAIASGIDAIPTEGLEPLYFGVSGLNRVDDRLAISYFRPEQHSSLEFDLAVFLSRLDKPDLPAIGILSGLRAFGPAADGSARRLNRTLMSGYDIDWLSGETLSIPDNVSTLLVIAPQTLSDYSAYQIDQFLLRKGRVIILIDPAPLLTGVSPPPEPLQKMLTHWGVTPSQNTLADDDLALTYGEGERQPLYPGPGPANRSRTDFLVSGLQRNINFGGAGWLNVDADINNPVTDLIFSGDTPGYLTPEQLQSIDLSPTGVRGARSPIGQKVPIAIRISGDFSTAYPDGSPEPVLPDDPVLRRITEGNLTDRPHLDRSETQGEIVIIADTDFLLDAFYVQPQTGNAVADNEAFILSMLDQFAGRPELAALRARPATRPMSRILDLRRRSEAEFVDAQDAAQEKLDAVQSRLRGPISEADPQLRAEYLAAREDLRRIQAAFRARIMALEGWLRFFTIWLPVALSILIGLGVHILRGRVR